MALSQYLYLCSATMIVVIAVAGTSVGENVKIVTPAGLQDTEGSGRVRPAAVPTRLQFLIPASDFAGLPNTHQSIVSFNYRADAQQTEAYDWSFENAQIWMSTTNVTPLTLSDKFNNNHGSDKRLVHSGPLTYRVLGTGPENGPRDIADGTRFQMPFRYDPSQGNLLIEQITFDENPVTSPRLDIVPTTAPGNTVLVSQVATDAEEGVLLNQPGVLQFEFAVPKLCDANGDGNADAADASAMFANWGGTGTGDCNGDGIVDAADAGMLFGEWSGDGPLSSTGALHHIPEPTHIGLYYSLALIFKRAIRRDAR